MKKSLGDYIKIILLNIVPILFSISCVIPVIWLFLSTLKTSAQFEASIIALPKSFNLENYKYVFETTPISLYIWNTLRNTAIILFLVLFFGFTNGYFFARFRFKLRSPLFGFYVSNLFIPIHALLVPTYIMFSFIGLTNKWYSTILPVASIELPVTIFLVNSYVSTIPKELEEAAAIDGSSFSRTLFSIILPIVTPVLVTAGIIAFFHCWNEFSYSLILFNKEKLYTISLALTRFKGENRIDYPKMMTAMTITMFPALMLYVSFSKQIIKGMVAGAIKG
ncbi:MAG: carbohydrate ABC transporter permease [Clostridiaceae bacterium]|nr:carbohydrate ABC transporter permease [Clostridiaceae bacterium]